MQEMAKKHSYNFRNLAGQRFGRLAVVSEVGRNKRCYVLWKCICDCGNDFTTASVYLLSGVTKSCGCLASEIVSKRMFKHGMSNEKLYSVWANMLGRCNNPNDHAYTNYGGRGIQVCAEWHDFIPFIDWTTNNGYAEGLEIDRIDNDGWYSPSNCRFVTAKQNLRNTRSNKHVTYDGKTMIIAEWAECLGMPHWILSSRLRNGWSVQDAFTKSVQRRGDRPMYTPCDLIPAEVPNG